MPYSIRKVRNQQCYAVKNTVSGAKCTTLEKAKRQVRLLHSIQKQKK